MRLRHVMVLGLATVLTAAFAAGVEAQAPPGSPPPPPPALPSPGSPRPPCPPVTEPKVPQPTRIEIDLFELLCTSDQLVRLDAKALGGGEGNGASCPEILKRLGELGAARLLMRVGNVVDLSRPMEFDYTKKAPIVQGASTGPDGKVSPNFSYNNVGFEAKIVGRWLDGPPRAAAELDCQINLSNVTPTSVETREGVKLPAFSNWKISQRIIAPDGQPVIILGNDVPLPGDGQQQTVVTVLRLAATRLPAPRAAQAHGGSTDQTLLRMTVIELTGDADKLDTLKPEQIVPADASDQNLTESLGKFGKPEILSRPTMMLGPDQGMLHIGEQVPIVQAIQKGADGSPKPEIKYEDTGLKLYVTARWLADAGPARASIDFRLEHTCVHQSSVDVGNNVTVPIVTQRTMNDVVLAEAGKPFWIAGPITRPAGKDRHASASRLLIRATAEKISPIACRAADVP